MSYWPKSDRLTYLLGTFNRKTICTLPLKSRTLLWFISISSSYLKSVFVFFTRSQILGSSLILFPTENYYFPTNNPYPGENFQLNVQFVSHKICQLRDEAKVLQSSKFPKESIMEFFGKKLFLLPKSILLAKKKKS